MLDNEDQKVNINVSATTRLSEDNFRMSGYSNSNLKLTGVSTDIHKQNDDGGYVDLSMSKDNEEKVRPDGLESIHILAYSTGHFCNDLCASMWFTYLLWFVNQVVGLNDTQSGYALLSGQLTDGITTPVVGLLSDKLNCIGGKRNFWYIFGTILVIPTFLGIFLNPGFL